MKLMECGVNMVLHGDSLELLKDFPDNSVDAIVTDPPYGLAFMGKKWDYDVPSVELWREVLRVLKPGGHLLSFGGTRTYHRMVVAVEDAGFEIRDQVQWIYGSGFPKSLDVSKAIDKAAGAEREVVGSMKAKLPTSNAKFATDAWSIEAGKMRDIDLTAPATDDAKLWQGWGTALKPANEPIVLARKPLEKGLTVAENVLKWGTGAINVDASRIVGADQDSYAKNWDRNTVPDIRGGNFSNDNGKRIENSKDAPQGRWPANVLFDEEAAAVLDEQSGTLSKQGSRKLKDCPSEMFAGGSKDSTFYGDSGGASRFFYVAKASKRERNAGLEGMPERKAGSMSGGEETRPDRPTNHPMRANFHPTVKPVKLMEYLIKLICPPGGIVLDPFMGSGTTGVAAKSLGVQFIGIEREEEYCKIAEKRIG